MTSHATQALGFTRRGRPILDDVTLNFSGGQLVSLMGANGAGKTTLLRLMLGLIVPDRGRVRVNDVPLTDLSRMDRARLLSYVPQNREHLPPYDVMQVVQMGRLPHGGLTTRLSRADHDSIERAIAQLGLQDLARRPCTTLSGGEYQRVLLARALAQETPVIVLDEPLAGLDYGYQHRLMRLLSNLTQLGRLVIMTAHQPEMIYRHASHVVLLEAGRVVTQGPPRDVLEAGRLSAFYEIALHHYDHGAERFFAQRDRVE
ncbi:ABC transporter ATP-binding protein [Asaia bogorensis]|uniref:ABC transporter ATP-binding protein n=1 Tax=Asaia bogorensis TaxID=91915 RepID=UPI00285A76A6|nr:ABC transporter ATP-binding protein [Asaia bogorensis]MDR6183885.1 iron complex transport system ATP-binding protein [Asaia bogorensis NBRC 16594]